MKLFVAAVTEDSIVIDIDIARAPKNNEISLYFEFSSFEKTWEDDYEIRFILDLRETE
jgi:hypothetical protein